MVWSLEDTKINIVNLILCIISFRRGLYLVGGVAKSLGVGVSKYI